MADVLITGASGLIGSEFLRTARDLEVVALGRSHDKPGVRWVDHDLRRPDLPRDLPRVETVIHLAQSRCFRSFPSGARDVFDVNVASTMQLVEWARETGARRFVFASSGGIYGHGAAEFQEDDSIPSRAVLGFYLASKRSAELLLDAFESELSIIILRFFFVYGPEQPGSMLLPRLVRSVIDRRPILLQGPSGLRINPVYVQEAAQAVLRASELSESTKVNVAGPEILTLREIGDLIGKAVGIEPVFDVNPDEHPQDLIGDVTKMTRLLCTPRETFAEHLPELVTAAYASGTDE